jgi:hypothetical protein
MDLWDMQNELACYSREKMFFLMVPIPALEKFSGGRNLFYFDFLPRSNRFTFSISFHFFWKAVSNHSIGWSTDNLYLKK